MQLGQSKGKSLGKRREAWSVRWHQSIVFHGFSLLLNKGMQFCCSSCWFDISWCELFAGNHGVFLFSRWITVDFLFPDLQKKFPFIWLQVPCFCKIPQVFQEWKSQLFNQFNLPRVSVKPLPIGREYACIRWLLATLRLRWRLQPLDTQENIEKRTH